MDPKDPILATGLPLHGETQAGVAVEQGVWELARAEPRGEMAEPAKHLGLSRAKPTREGGWRGGSGVGRRCLGLALPACHQLQDTRHLSTQH